jgi:hypothetical protein
VDVDRFLAFAAVEVLLGHTNGYALARSRYRIYSDPGTGRLVFLPHGIEGVFTRPDAPITPEMKGLLAKAILETPQGKKRYREEMGKVVTKSFKVDLIQARVKELAAKLKPALGAGAEAHDKAVKDLLDRVTARQKSVEQQLKQT